MSYLSDKDRLAQDMGQWQVWENKLFYWSGDKLGWRYLKGV